MPSHHKHNNDKKGEAFGLKTISEAIVPTDKLQYGAGITGELCDIFSVSINIEIYSASVTAVLFAISCYIGPHYNGAEMYRLIIMTLVELRVVCLLPIANMTTETFMKTVQIKVFVS